MFPLEAMNVSELLRFVLVSRRSTSPTRQPSLYSTVLSTTRILEYSVSNKLIMGSLDK